MRWAGNVAEWLDESWIVRMAVRIFKSASYHTTYNKSINNSSASVHTHLDIDFR